MIGGALYYHVVLGFRGRMNSVLRRRGVQNVRLGSGGEGRIAYDDSMAAELSPRMIGGSPTSIARRSTLA